jgi:hypothetical protein
VLNEFKLQTSNFKLQTSNSKTTLKTGYMEERLWDYIDGNANASEKAEISRLLYTNPEWKAKYDELVELQQLIHSSELEQPSMRFAQNVMEEISKLYIAPATKTYINKKIIYGIGGFFITMIVGLLVYSIAQVNWSEGGSSSAMPDLNSIDWSTLMNNTYMNIFMMVNVVLGLMLLDKYLTHKKEALKEKNI